MSNYSIVAHRDLAIMNPLGSVALDAAIAQLELDSTARVIDIGCGKGEFLRRVHAKYGCAVEGVDLSPTLIDDARCAVPSGRFHVADARSVTLDGGTFDVAACIGAAHAFGTTRDALEALGRLGRIVVFADAYYRREPEDGYLAATGLGRDEFLSPDAVIELAAELGLSRRDVHFASEADFVHYETAHARAVAEHAQRNPDDAEALAMRDRSRAWNDAFERWGRTTLGFALFVFAKI